METLDRRFENVCELDLIFHVDKVRKRHTRHESFCPSCAEDSPPPLTPPSPAPLSQVHHILDEIVMGGMVLETSMPEVLTHIEAQEKALKAEVRPRLLPLVFTRPRASRADRTHHARALATHNHPRATPSCTK